MAAVAGVSVTTVSDALNHKGRLSEETRQRVKETARRLGYRPSVTARHLATGMSGLIAVVLSQSPESTFAVGDSDYFIQLANAGSSEAFDNGYGVVLAPPMFTDGLWSRIAVDGALIVDPVANDPTIPILRRLGLPFVTIGRDLSESDGDNWVDSDSRAATHRILEHVYEQGARRVAVVSGPRNTSYLLDVGREYDSWTNHRGLSRAWIEVGSVLTEGAGYDATLDLLESEQPPDAIYATSDRLALGALLAARAKGVRVPDQLMIAAACTDSDVVRTASPPLTIVDFHAQEMGCHAIRILLNVIRGNESSERHRLVDWSLEVRESTSRTSASRRAVRSVGMPTKV